MIVSPWVAALNHLLHGQRWARERLRPFADKQVLFRLAPLPDIRLRILDSGLVEPAASDVAADLIVTARPEALPRLFARDASALAQVELAGPADLASTVQFLFRELSWDAEEDLSRVVGDVLAHRAAAAARDFLAWQKDAAIRLAQNLAEYLTEEQPVLAAGAEAASFRRSLEILNEDCTRLEGRLARLEASAKRGRS